MPPQFPPGSFLNGFAIRFGHTPAAVEQRTVNIKSDEPDSHAPIYRVFSLESAFFATVRRK